MQNKQKFIYALSLSYLFFVLNLSMQRSILKYAINNNPYLARSIRRRNNWWIVFGQIKCHFLHEPFEGFAVQSLSYFQLFTYVTGVNVSLIKIT